MNWREFEDRLRQQVVGHTTSVDGEAIWESLQKKKKRRWGLWFFLFALLCGGIGLNHWMQVKNEEVQHSTVKSEKVLKSEQQCHQATMDTLLWIASNAGGIAQPKEQIQLNLNKDVRKPESKISDKQQNSKHSQNGPITGKNRNSKNVQSKENIVTTNEKSKKQIIREASITPSPFGKIEIIADSVNFKANASPIEIAIIYPPLQNQNNSDQTSTELEKNKLLQNPDSIAGKEIINPITIRKTEDSTDKNKVTQVKHSKKYLNPWIGYGKWDATFTPGDSIGSILSILRDSLERELEYLEVGMHFPIWMKGNWTAYSGIQFIGMNSVMNWKKDWVVKDSISTIRNIYIDGTVDTTYEQGLIILNYHREVQHFNAFYQLNFPIGVKYAIALGSNILLEPGISATIHLWQQSKGRFIYVNDTFKEKLPGWNSSFGLNLSMEASIGCTIPIYRMNFLTLDYRYATSLVPVNLNGFGYKQKIQSSGIRVGVKIPF